MPNIENFTYDFSDKLPQQINLARTNKSPTLIKLYGLHIYMNTDKQGYTAKLTEFKGNLCYKIIYNDAPNDIFISKLNGPMNKIIIYDNKLIFNNITYYLEQDKTNKIIFKKEHYIKPIEETYIKIICLNNFK